MAELTKAKRSQFVTFLDTTPLQTDATYALLGIGVTDYGIAYNPQIETEKWIIDDSARNDHTSNQKQGSVSQKIYKEDACYQFVKGGLDKLNYVTKILDIDKFNGTTQDDVTTFPAKLSDGLIAITSYLGEDAVIEYDLYYNGDPIEGTCTISQGVPTFTPSAN